MKIQKHADQVKRARQAAKRAEDPTGHKTRGDHRPGPDTKPAAIIGQDLNSPGPPAAFKAHIHPDRLQPVQIDKSRNACSISKPEARQRLQPLKIDHGRTLYEPNQAESPAAAAPII